MSVVTVKNKILFALFRRKRTSPAAAHLAISFSLRTFAVCLKFLLLPVQDLLLPA